MVNQIGAIGMFVSDDWTFTSTDATWLVLHKTAGFTTAQECAAYFQAGSDGRHVSSHYIIGQDGTIVQCVLESRGAGANCCLETGHASYLPTDINLNMKTISIEHIDPAADNSTPLTEVQAHASFQLVHDICVRHNIPMRPGDAQGGIIGHSDIAPLSRARCPGNYPWNDLWQFLGGQSMTGTPQGWHDDGTILTAPNNVPVKMGFRTYVLAHNWDPNNYPLKAEQGIPQLEMSNPALGGGTWQPFRWTVLEWDSKRGVQEMWTGQEILAERDRIAELQSQITALQAQLAQAQNVTQIQQQLDQATAQIHALQQKIAQIKQAVEA